MVKGEAWEAVAELAAQADRTRHRPPSGEDVALHGVANCVLTASNQA